TGGCVLSLQCKVGEVCEEVLQVPLVNMLLEEALAVWAQHCMSATERRRRILTRSLHSSTVRATTAMQKLLKHPFMRDVYYSEKIEYKVDVSLPQYFSLPRTVSIPVKEDTNVPWETSAGTDTNLKYKNTKITTCLRFILCRRVRVPWFCAELIFFRHGYVCKNKTE
ncbi:hypothetical protein CHARACLAT_027760, partial [Characodon lateralis]|nr:hypothetical protein [Characodon lateralis]